jgi:AcrR family transcriptional regulator
VRVRADARRNRERIQAAARDLVAAAGVDATMEDIARRAGVAVGTLYRHFPAKEDLLAAVVDDSVDQLAGLAEAGLAQVDAGAPPGPVVRELFRSVAARYADDRALKAAAGRLGLGADLGAHLAAELAAAGPGSVVQRAMAALTTLLERAVAAGEMRADVTLDDVVMMLDGVPGREVPEAMRARYVDIVIAGLTART